MYIYYIYINIKNAFLDETNFPYYSYIISTFYYIFDHICIQLL